jgi:hypothetical protein
MQQPFHNNSGLYRKYGADGSTAAAPFAAVITPPYDIRQILDRQLVIIV